MNTLSDVIQTYLVALLYTNHCEEAHLAMKAHPNFKLPNMPPNESIAQAYKRVS